MIKTSIAAPSFFPLDNSTNLKVRRHALRWREYLITSGLALCALISVVTTLATIIVLSRESISFFSEVPITDFLFGTRWVPLLEPRSYGVVPLLWGTLQVTFGAALIAVPIGLASAIYLSEYASLRTRSVVKPTLELLAGIPTVVYGYFALTFITPVLQSFFPSVQVFNALSGAIVVGLMILPTVTTLSDNALRAVPRSLREGAYALGSTSCEVTTQVVVPAGLSGVVASFILAISRAIGETMAVTLAAGATPNLALSFTQSIQTMTAYIVQVSLGDTPSGTIVYQTLFAVGALLFVITLLLNICSQWVLNRYREAYDE